MIGLKQEFEVFLFANPRSGSNHAKRYVELDFDICQMEIGDKKDIVRLYVYDITNPERILNGYKLLAKTQR